MQLTEQNEIKPSRELCRSVLIIDDNESLRVAMIGAIAKTGIPAVGAKNGREALTLLPTLQAPTLIFLDLMMPMMNGWELLEHLRVEPSLDRNKVVLMSAVSSKPRPDHRPLPKTEGVLQKPLTLTSVLGYVDRLCKAP